jgi:hypothetical protein
MKDDERELLERLQKRTNEDPNPPYVRQLVADIGMNEKRAAYICEKWADKGLYDYGISSLAGWLTDAGKAL